MQPNLLNSNHISAHSSHTADSKSWSGKKLLLFSFISITLVLLLLEIVFRILFAIEYKGYHTSLYVQGNTLQKNDSLLIFRNRPLYLDYYRRYQFNEEGMKSTPGQVQMPVKQVNDYWVFLFGGSAMEGMGSNKDGAWLDITGVQDYRQDETIAAHLQTMLQLAMPSKKVRVFNAANSGFTVWQSRLRYQELSARYAMDWVISMDGENEPPVLKPEEDAEDFIRERWATNALSKFPVNLVVALTSHSALINKIKQSLFDVRLSGRMRRNERENYPARQKWAAQPPGKLNVAPASAAMEKAVRAFYAQLAEFDGLLARKQQPHLLYIQPHLAVRDASVLDSTERALFNYYTATYNDPYNNSFKRRIFSGRDSLPPGVRPMTALHTWNKAVFVDYCHFTSQANRYIATLMASDILKGKNN